MGPVGDLLIRIIVRSRLTAGRLAPLAQTRLAGMGLGPAARVPLPGALDDLDLEAATQS